MNWLQEYGYQQIETATNSKEVKAKLDHHFDVIISDMRMEEDDSGFVIANEIKARNLSSLIIIMTANDEVDDCRNAFKSGAWDYIRKNMPGNVFDVLSNILSDAFLIYLQVNITLVSVFLVNTGL